METSRHAVFVTIRTRSAGVELTVPADDPKVDAARWADLEAAEVLVGDYKPPLGEVLARTPIEQ